MNKAELLKKFGLYAVLASLIIILYIFYLDLLFSQDKFAFTAIAAFLLVFGIISLILSGLVKPKDVNQADNEEVSSLDTQELKNKLPFKTKIGALLMIYWWSPNHFFIRRLLG
jgi:hypothetical protein